MTVSVLIIMKLVIEIGASGGVSEKCCANLIWMVGIHSKTCSIDRKSHGAFVKKNLDQKFDLTQKLEQFSEKKSPLP